MKHDALYAEAVVRDDYESLREDSQCYGAEESKGEFDKEQGRMIQNAMVYRDDFERDLNVLEPLHEDASSIPEVMPFDMKALPSSLVPNSDDVIYCVAVLWVDDLGITTNSKRFREYLISRFLRKFPGTVERDPNTFLGIAFEQQDDGTVELTQRPLIESYIKTCGMEDGKSVPTPIVEEIDSTVKGLTVEEWEESEKIHMAKAAGELGFLRHSRPDIIYAHGQLARVVNSRSATHHSWFKRVARYLKGTVDEGSRFNPRDHSALEVFADSNFSDTTFTGIVAIWRGGPLFVRSFKAKQKTIDTMNAELCALSEAAKVAVWLRELLGELGYPQTAATRIWGDNQSSIQVVNNIHCFSKKVRHIRVRMAWMKQRIANKEIEVQYCPTGDNIADLGTKPVGKETFARLKPYLMGWKKMIPQGNAEEKLDAKSRLKDQKARKSAGGHVRGKQQEQQQEPRDSKFDSGNRHDDGDRHSRPGGAGAL